MAKYNKAHALSQFVKDIDEEQRRKKKLQEALDTHKQNSPTSSTSVKGKQIAPIRTDTQYIANRILGGQTIEQRYAPLMNVQETPTTSTELFNKLKEQNETSVNKQNSSGGIIDSFKEQYQAGLKKNKEEQNLQQQIEQEKREQGILSEEELNELSRQALSNDKLSNKKMLGKKSGETDLEALQRIKLENAKKEQEYNKKSEKVKALNEIQGKKRADVINATSKLIKYGVEKKFLDNPLNDVDGGLGSTINMFRRISEKAKTGQRATVSDIVGSSGLSAIADRGRRINKSKLDSAEDNETTLNLKQQQSALNKQLLSIKNKKSDKFKKTLREYNRITDELQAEQANILGLHDGALGGIERFSNVLTGGFDESTQGFDSTIDKLFGMESDKAKGATQTLSDKSFRDTNNKIGKTILEAAHSAGAMIPSIIAGIASGGISTAVAFGTYGGSAYNQAKRDGYTDEQATKYGVVNGGLEAILNKILPTFKLGGKNVYGKVATDKLTKKIMAKTVGNEALKRLVTDSAGEFTEEYLQEFLDPIVREALLEEDNGVGIIKGADGKKIASNIAKYTAHNFFSKENLHAGLLGALNSGLMGAPSAIKSNAYTKATGRSSETGLTQNEQAVIDNIVENRKAELKEKNGKVTKKDISKIEQEVRQDLERGYIETNDIERALSNEEWTKHDNVVKQKEQLENQIKELESKTPQDYKTMGELNSSNEELNRLKEQLKNIDTNTTRNELNSAMNGKITDKDTLLQRAYGEEIEKQNAYQFDKNEKITEQTKKINEDIEKLGLNNNIKIRDIVDLIKKLSNETGRQYRLIDNNSAEMEKVEGKNVDGFVKNGEVFINVDSENLINRILGHETTHLFEGTEDYTKLQNIAIEYAKTKGEYDNRKSSLEEVYKDIKDANIENELTSDLVGDYLFSDIEFVRNLSTEQPNIFKKMYNYVKHLYNMATAGSKEARQLEQLKYNFEKVYRENNQSKASDNTKLKIKSNEKGLYVKADRQVIKGNNTLKWEQQVEDYINNEIRNGKDVNVLSVDGDILTITKDTSGKAKFRNYYLDNNGNKHYMSDEEFKTKLTAETHIDELAKVSKKGAKTVPDYKNHSFAKDGFNYRTAFFEDFDGQYYKITMSVGKNGNINTIYNIGKLAQRKRPVISGSSVKNGANGSLTTNNIPQNEPKVNSDIPTKYSIQNKEKNTQELDNSSFSNEKKYRGSHQIENAKALTELSINDIENRVKEVDGYLTKQSESDLRKLKKILNNPNEKVKIYRASPVNELNGGDWVTTDKSYAQNVANNNGGKVYTYEVDAKQLYYPDNVKDLPSLHRLSSFQYVEETSNTTKYSISNKDSNGRTLTKQQQNYFKDSKATDENGNLITVYHGSKKAGFTTFSTKDNVNFYTDSNNVANTYSGSNEKVDTRKLESINDAKSWLKGINEYSYIDGNTVYDYDGEAILKYNTKEELLRNLKRDIQKEFGDTEAGGVYEGYVNLANPYVIDVDGKNWNNITIGINDNVEKMYNSLSSQEKEYLSDLADKMDDSYSNYNDALEGFYQRLNANNETLYDKVTVENSIREKLYDTALYQWNDTYVEDLIGKRHSTDDIVKQILEQNKNGANYDGIIFKNIIDEGMFDSGSKEQTVSNVYVTFNPNQFKALDNKTPTQDADIRYKISDKNDIAPTSNNDIRARDMLLPRQQEIQKAIAPIQEENKVLKQEVKALQKEVRDIQESKAITQEEFEEQNKRIAPLLEEQEAPLEVEQVYDNLKDTTRMPRKEVKLLSKNIKDTLGLTNRQKLDLEEIIQDYSTSETATREDLYNDIKNRYGKQAIITEYEDIRNVQTKVKSMKLDVSDNIKHSIADYNKLKQKNFGKISFSRNGQPVDVVYQELNAEYPNYFPDNIYNETDQFQKIVEVANLENKSIEEYDIDDNYVRETSDYIYDSILDSKQDAIQKATEKAAKESLQGELKAPMPTKLTQLYDDIDTDDVISASVKYEGKFADKSVDQLQQVKRKLKHTIENPFANTETINAAREQYAELGQEFSRRGLNIKDTIVEDAIRLMEHKAQKKTKSDKSKATRTPLDFGTLDELQNRAKARKNSELIETLNQMDTETENKLIEEQNKTKPKKESKLKKALTYGQYLFTNRNVEIDNYAKETGNHNIQVLADQVSNIQTEISNNINNAQTDNNLNTIGKSITQIFSQADKSGLSEAFNDYLFHLSNIERHKWGKGSQVPMVDSFVLTEEYEKKYPEMKQWAKDVNKYNKNLLYKQADAGLITKELADGLSERYEFYVPFMENLEGEYTPDKTNTIKTRSTVKRAKGGSSRNLLGFEEAMIRQTESAISQIRKNQLYQEIVKTKENTTTDFENNTNPDIHDNGLFSDNGKYYLTAYVDGKATQVEIDKTLYHGLAQNGNRMIQQAEQKLSPITKPLQALSSARRNILTTWSPTFLITNPLKDIQDAPLNSKYAKDWAKSMPKSIKEIASGKGGVELENFLNGYGQANLRGDYNLDSGLSDVTKLVDKKSSNKGIGISKKMLKKIPQINEKIELIPRYAEYLASIENGCSQMEALYNAREVTTNFGRGGIITKALNRNGFTFLNANVQGMSKLVRNFSGENGGRAVLGCIAKATALGIAPALLNALLFDDDDDYDVIPDYIKDNYYLIKTSDKSFIRIPKGRMMSIFGSAARRTLEATKGRENAFEGYLTNAYNQVGVQNPLESNILAPIIQAKNNQTWYGSELVPKRLQTNKQDGTKIPAKQQYDASTDKFSIWLGDKLNISPYKINYVLDQYSGGVGDMILPTITEEAQSDKDDTAGKMIAPLKDKFTADSITDNKYVTNFYSKLEELGEKKNATGSKKDEMSYQYMQNISFEMGALYKEMREVQANTKLADSKKYAKVQNIKAEINRLAEEGMKGYKDVESYDNYARVGDRELYKYQSKNGKTGWSDSNGQYADDINQLGLTTQEKNEYYTTKMKMSDVANGFKEDEGAEKYRAVLKTIRNAKIPSDAKYELYNSWYGKSDEASSVIQDLGISANDYLKFKTADLTSNKNKNGYAIRGSKADKVTSYLNKTNLNKGQKAVLYRLSFSYKGNYSSTKYSNAYNKEIINYIDNSNLTYEESVNALKKLGFKVSKDGTVKWD